MSVIPRPRLIEKKIFIVFWIMGQCNNFLEIFIFKATSSADQNKLTSYKLNQVRFSRNVFHHTRFQLEKEGWHFCWQQIVRSNTQFIRLFYCFCRHFSCKNQLVAPFELQTQMPGYRVIFCDIVCSKMLNSYLRRFLNCSHSLLHNIHWNFG